MALETYDALALVSTLLAAGDLNTLREAFGAEKTTDLADGEVDAAALHHLDHLRSSRRLPRWNHSRTAFRQPHQ